MVTERILDRSDFTHGVVSPDQRVCGLSECINDTETRLSPRTEPTRENERERERGRERGRQGEGEGGRGGERGRGRGREY